MAQLTCQKCGLTMDQQAALRAGWLMAQRKDAPAGHLVVRCPEHRTGHALRLAGLPQQSQSRKVEENLDAGLWVEYGSGYIASAHLDNDDAEKYILLLFKDAYNFKTQDFDTIPALIVAMRQVEPDLRKWRVRKE